MKTNAVHINQQLLDITYSYDAVGNITNISNQGSQVINPYNHTYTYDNDYRLLTTLGSGTFDNNPISYTYGMSYSPSGKVLTKSTYGDRLDNNGKQSINIDNQYNYYADKPQQLENVYNQSLGEDDFFQWDEKGNMKYHYSKAFDERKLCWTEDNRLQAFSDRNNGAYYGYDASGERAYKLTGTSISINQNGTNINVPILQNQTLYSSALITLSDKGYTKHYFEEGKRICSKIGNGGLIDINTPANTDISYPEQQQTMSVAIDETFNSCIGATPYVSTNDLYKTISTYEHPKITPNEPAYFYHSDHLGSSSYITDESGLITQTLAYLPYGEDWVNLVSNNPLYETTYKYNGKEKDDETGYNYYGARYYSSDLPIWLSVDPKADKLPSWTPYNYCLNNPIKLIDPDGEYPQQILNRNKDNTFSFNKSTVHLLSLVTGVSKYQLSNTLIAKAKTTIFPGYNTNQGGGAVTLGKSSYSAIITFTKNWFNDNSDSYEGHGYGQSPMAWLMHSAHEAGHIPQIDEKGGMLGFIGSAVVDYIANGHQNAEIEKSPYANEGVLKDFSEFVNKKYEKNGLEKLFNSRQTQDNKIKQIDKWWAAFQNSNN